LVGTPRLLREASGPLEEEEEEEEEDQEVGVFQSSWVGAGGRSRGRVPLPAAGAQT
jgi:hypothetical protein